MGKQLNPLINSHQINCQHKTFSNR